MKKVILLTLLSGLTFAAKIKVQCATPRSNVVIKINGSKLSFKGRFPAETIAQRTRYNGESITKIFYVAGEKHTVHLNNRNNFSDLEDFVSIRTQKGHEMTYPLNCNKF